MIPVNQLWRRKEEQMTSAPSEDAIEKKEESKVSDTGSADARG